MKYTRPAVLRAGFTGEKGALKELETRKTKISLNSTTNGMDYTVPLPVQRAHA